MFAMSRGKGGWVRAGLRVLLAIHLFTGLGMLGATPPSEVPADYHARLLDPALEGSASWDVANPAHNLRAIVTRDRLRLFPLLVESPAWVLDLSVAHGGGAERGGAGRACEPSGRGNQVTCRAGRLESRLTSTPDGLELAFVLDRPAPGASATDAAALTIAISGSLTPLLADGGAGVEFVTSGREPVLRYGPLRARGVTGRGVPFRLEVTDDSWRGPGTLAIRLDAAAADYPVTVEAAMVSPRADAPGTWMEAASRSIGQVPEGAGETVGIPWTGEPGVVETVREIMEREARAPRPAAPLADAGVRPQRRHWPRGLNPSAAPVAQWPPVEAADAPVAGAPVEGPDAPGAPGERIGPSGPAPESPEPMNPQPAGTSFLAVNYAEAGAIPPDTAGDVGPSQILVAVKGRIKVFDKAGILGGLNASLDTFFNSVRNAVATTEPQVRYDRLSGRWFVIARTTTAPNRILIAVSGGATITNSASFTFHFFRHDLVSPAGDTGALAADVSLGVDRLALYIGTNTYNSSGTTLSSSAGFVVNKANLLAGTLTVTAFRGLIITATSVGPYAPRGVDNDNPAATQGYFIGADYAVFSRLVLRRVTDPGGTPAISANILLNVPTTNYPINVPHLGMTSGWVLDGHDDRLFSARIGTNKLTGAVTLWTAHNIEVNASGTSVFGGGRNGSRWYQIGNLTGTPTLTQSGTLFNNAASNPRSFWIPSVAMSGQGHMALGSSTAGAQARIDAATAGRLSGDTLGTIQAFTQLTASTTAYNVTTSPLPSPTNPQPWGDYSHVTVDPNDNQTMWTFQEYCDATNSWGVRAVQLLAPPPANVTSAAPSSVCVDSAPMEVTITGTASAGSAFFDPGADAGGPGFPNRIGAAISRGVVVNGVTFNSATQVTVNLSTSGASAGPADVTVTNPDGQSRTGVGVLTVAAATPTTASNNGPVCAGTTLRLFATTVPGASYIWTGPNGFSSSQQNPTILNTTMAAAGTYTVTTLVNGCVSTPSTTVVSVSGDGGTCNDGSACTQTDTCVAGACVGSNPVVCTALDQCHDAGVCNPGTGVCSDPPKPDGTACTDGDVCTTIDTCQAGACAGASPVVCTALDQCHDPGVCDPGTGVCSNPTKPDGAACSDGNACTTTDSCQAGACTAGAPVVCTALDQCHDAGVCDPGTGVCSNPPKLDGTVCDDGDACTQADACQAGACVGANPVVCTAQDQCHDAGVCNPGTGVCSNPPKANGSACSDGNACTTTDSCQSGTCTAGAPVACTALDQCHDAGVCDPGTGACSNPPKPNGTTCTDGNACTQIDACQSGTCTAGAPVVCTALDQCHDPGVCDPGTGVCSDPPKPDGAACTDGNACTTTDVCQSGTCTAGAPVVCTALDQCHDAGVCDPGTGVCSNPPKPDGAACTDGNACTQADACQAGTCTAGVPVVCTALDQCHDAGVCDPGTGVCSNPPKPNGTTCTDGNACTQIDVCQSGTCTAGAPVVCTALDQCHDAGVCDPGTGVCSNPPKLDGTVCDDGDACTQADACQAGTCVGANPVVCAPLDQCHDPGVCDPGTGVCTNPPKANGSACTDGDACTQTDSCQAGACVGANPVVCTAQDQCHDAGVCNPGTGVCTNPPKANGSACTDGDACTQTDSCQTGACVGASPVVCTAQDQCHDAGVCNPGTGVCSNPPKLDGTVCNDGDACTQTDACQAGACAGANPVVCTALDQCHDAGVCDPGTGVCTNPPKANGSACSDGDACTQTDSCQAGACVGANPVVCTAQDQCHDAGVCNPGTGVCTNPPKANGSACSDGDACTQTDSCQAGACVGANPVVCTAQDQCHDAGVCNPGTGVCTDPPKPDGSACSDGNACTTTDNCQSGTCTAGAPVVCTALDQCHDAGVCNPGTGICSDPPKPDGTTCTDGNACTQIDACQSGTCVSGSPVVCTPLDQCHDAGVCNPGTGACSNPPKPDGTTCTDGDACTTTDACQAGTCAGGPPPDADGDGRADGLCGGTDCNDADPLVWAAPGEVANLIVASGGPTGLAWDSQEIASGPATRYDLVSGTIADIGVLDFAAAACLQTDGPAGYDDGRPDPPEGSAYWYLARGRNACGIGTWGSTSRDAVIAACP